MIKNRLSAALCAGIFLAGGLHAADSRPYVAEGKELGKVDSAMPLLISANRQDSRGKCGEKIIFSVTPVHIPEKAEKIRIFQWRNGLLLATDEYAVKDFTVAMSSADAAHLMLTGVYIDQNGNVIDPPPRTKGYGDGVFIEPEKLLRSRPRPADFDSFWDNELQKLSQVPMDPIRETIRQDASLRGEEITLTALDDIPVTGYLAIPVNAAPRSLPAVLYFHGAGFKSSQLRTEFKEHAIVFDVNAHGIKNGMPREFYRELNRRPPTNRRIYSHRNDREKSYFKNMFLRTARALEFIKSLPEWNGKTLIVSGRSQGGAQAIAAAALDKDVTLCIANVPALADHGGQTASRKPGWPGINPKNRQDIATASDYVDIINFAGRIKCETIMSIGMIDSICPPVSVWMTYQELNVPKSVTFFPQQGHNAPPEALDGRKRIRKEILR